MQNNFTSLNGSIHSLFNQRFSFKHLAALVASVLVILCAVWLPYALFWQLDGLLSLQQAQIIGSTMFYGGIASFVAIAVVTRFRLSKDWSLKRNVGLFSILLLTTLVFSSLLSAPVVAALTPLPSDTGPNNSSAFKFSVPFTEYQWVVAQFRDGTYYAINGSDWNIMTIVEPWQAVAPWAALAGNKTALVEQVLSVTGPGKVLLNELSFDYALTVPENVTVVESLNGLTRSFINEANTQGSPYTISVDTVQDGYYLAQDSADRYIDEWSSLDLTTVCNQAINATYDDGGGKVFANLIGQFSVTGIRVKSNVEFYGAGMDKTVFILAAATNGGVISNFDEVAGNNNIYIHDFTANANLLQQTNYSRGVEFLHVSNFTISNVCGCNSKENSATHTLRGVGIYVGQSSHDGLILNCKAYGNQHEGIGIRNGCSKIAVQGCISFSNSYEGYQVAIEETGNSPCSDITFTGCIAYNDGTQGFCIDIDSDTFTNGGAYGITLTGCIVDGCYGGLFINGDANAITVTGCTFRNLKTIAGVFATNGICIRERVQGLTITGNTFTNFAGVGIITRDCLGAVISSNDFSGGGHAAIQIGTTGNPGSANILIIGNKISNCSVTGKHTYTDYIASITITNNTTTNPSYIVNQNITISDNIIQQTNGGYAVSVGGVRPQNITIQNNNIGSSSLFLGTNPTVSLLNNRGYNYGVVAATKVIALPFIGNSAYIYDSSGDNSTITSGWTYTNCQSPKQVFITSGTLTELQINGQAVSTSTTGFILQIGDTFTPTFSDSLTIIAIRE